MLIIECIAWQLVKMDMRRFENADQYDIYGINIILIDAVNGDEKLARTIEKALKKGQVDRVLTKVDSKGVTTTFRLNADGKIIGTWP